MIIKNGLVFGTDGSFSKKNIIINGERIEDIVQTNSEVCDSKMMDMITDKVSKDISDDVIDAEGMYVIPGLIDIHFHGCVGVDFCDGTIQSLRSISEYELSNGITSICPASMSLDEERLTEIFSNVARYVHEQKNLIEKDTLEKSEKIEISESIETPKCICNEGSRLVGINMEGPFISPIKKGAQNEEYICKPDINMFKRLNEISEGLIRIVDIAPEEDGAMEFIENIVGDGTTDIKISLAHTMADYDTAVMAFDRGADHVTHLYNAMRPFDHRSPGVIGAAADCEKVFVELITDGVHCADSVVRTSFKIFGDDRIVFISDSMEACGMPNGEYELGGQKVYVNGNRATLKDGTIAGSVTNLMDCMKIAVERMHIPLESVIKCVTQNPAKSIGIFNEYGSIDLRKYADMVILDSSLEIQSVISRGRLCFSK